MTSSIDFDRIPYGSAVKFAKKLSFPQMIELLKCSTVTKALVIVGCKQHFEALLLDFINRKLSELREAYYNQLGGMLKAQMTRGKWLPKDDRENYSKERDKIIEKEKELKKIKKNHLKCLV